MLNRVMGAITGMLAVTFLLLFSMNAASAADDRLVVTQDENSMERVIENYLVTTHKLVINEKGADNDDLYLELPMKGDPMPAYRISIDSQPLNRDKETDKVIERGVLINLLTTIKVPKERRAAVLEVINDFNRKKAFASIYIDTDGEIVCCWILNVLSDGLPTENVYDAVARVQNIWKVVYPEVAKVL